jgi:hypothetical protein
MKFDIMNYFAKLDNSMNKRNEFELVSILWKEEVRTQHVMIILYLLLNVYENQQKMTSLTLE